MPIQQTWGKGNSHEESGLCFESLVDVSPMPENQQENTDLQEDLRGIKLPGYQIL